MNQQDQPTDLGTQVYSGNNNPADHSWHNAEHIPNGADAATEVYKTAAETSKLTVQSAIEATTQQAHTGADRLAEMFRASGDEARHLATQTKKNTEAVAQCKTVLKNAFQDVTHRLVGMGHKQWQRNLDGVKKLVAAKSIHEYAGIQSDLIWDGIEEIMCDTRYVTEASFKAIDDSVTAFKKPIDQAVQ